ncbi:STAS domain-containing protein [Nocardia sp. NPDC050193]
MPSRWRWRQQVRAAADTVTGPRGALVVDATRLDFLSVRSLAALSDEAQRYRRGGVEILLVTAEPALARIARADTRTALLPVCSTVVSALTAVHLRYQAPELASGEPEKERTRDLVDPDVTGRSDLPDAVPARRAR